MTERTPIHHLHRATITEDALTKLIREAAKAVVAEAISAKAEEHIDRLPTVVDEMGNRRVILNGYLPEREIQTVAGVLPIRQPRARAQRRAINAAGLTRWRTS